MRCEFRGKSKASDLTSEWVYFEETRIFSDPLAKASTEYIALLVLVFLFGLLIALTRPPEQ